MIVASNDHSAFPWGCKGSTITVSGTAQGTGFANTVAVVGQCSDNNTAADACYDYVFSNKDDWYLPSKDEVYIMHQNLYINGQGNFSNIRYWTSSQVDADNAWCQHFDSTGVLDQVALPKNQAYKVRPVRSF